MSENVVGSALQGVPSSMRDAMIQRAMQDTAHEVTPKLLLQTLLFGAGAGAGLAGLRTVGKVLKRSQPLPATYTMPVQADIYPSAPVKKKSRKKIEPKQANFITDVSAGVAKPGDLLKFVAAGSLGAFAGYGGGRRVADAISAAARKRQLVRARSDFELALQEISTPDPAGKPKKLASSPEMLRLAENCRKLAVSPSAMEVIKGWLPYMALLSGGAGAAYGYSSYQDSSKRKALEFAERQVNQDREKLNPTFTTAQLIKSDADTPEEDREADARQQMQELLEQDYPYL